MWTKVSEGVPEIGQEVLVLTALDSYMVLRYGKDGFNTVNDKHNEIKCKAWMEIPAPPKEEKK